jgi:hypothetical protein
MTCFSVRNTDEFDMMTGRAIQGRDATGFQLTVVWMSPDHEQAKWKDLCHKILGGYGLWNLFDGRGGDFKSDVVLRTRVGIVNAMAQKGNLAEAVGNLGMGRLG